MSFYPQDQQEAARALLAKPVVDTAASDAGTGSSDGSVEIIEVYGQQKYGRAFGLFDRPGVLAGRLKGRVEGEVGAWVERTPGARTALTTVEFGMAIAGGPVRFFAGLGLSAAHEKVVQKATGRFEAVGYSAEIARSGGEGLPWLAGIALGSTSIVTNRINGSIFENNSINGILGHIGVGKNTKTVTQNKVNTIPDIMGRLVGLVEFKDERYSTRSKQLTAQLNYADQSGMPFNLVVSPNTKAISKPLIRQIEAITQRNGGGIYRYDPATDTLTPW